jgi:ketose-bisphosphate aldolase
MWRTPNGKHVAGKRTISNMPLVSMKEMLQDARRRGYAACYCESWNLESLQAVVEAAEAEKSPVIAGFNGGFLLRSGQSTREKLRYYAAVRVALEGVQVPIAFLLNETDSFTQIEDGIALGFNAVMVENEALPPEEYQSLVRRVVAVAHANGVSVEAQVGHLADASEGSEAQPTDPQAARSFIKETQIDALGVAVGNVHILTSGKRTLDLDALKKVQAAVDTPLVLHGGTGIPLEMAPRCIEFGVAKVNFGTGLKQTYLAAVAEKLAHYRKPMSPHPFLGLGGENDLLVAGREAVKAEIIKLLRAFKSTGKA